MGVTTFYNPPYYNRGKIQVWDFIRDQELNYHLGNVVKYVCRAGHKGDSLEDLDKAIHYLTNERDALRRERGRVPEEFQSTRVEVSGHFEAANDTSL